MQPSLFDHIPIVPLEAFFDLNGVGPNRSHDPKPELIAAEIILGVDVMTQNEFLVYGRERLGQILMGNEDVEVTVLRIGVDQETEELEKLTAMVEVVKGRHDYQPS
jgi:hypothetical protein